jgi:hypothetical protein
MNKINNSDVLTRDELVSFINEQHNIYLLKADERYKKLLANEDELVRIVNGANSGHEVGMALHEFIWVN